LKAQLDREPRNYETLRKLAVIRYYMVVIDSKTQLQEAVQYL
jgi:hypothetical protein